MKAVGISSGGLDSLIAVRLLQQLGAEVVAMHFMCGFEPTHLRRMLEGAEPRPPEALVETGAEVELVDVREAFLAVLADPAHGYGAHLNPCIDCKILMLQNARERMERLGADFVFTGEVLGQRPMSQRKDALMTIARESGLADRLVRPLSAGLLPETAPERAGLFTREQLPAIRGRGRYKQKELARELRIHDYPTPAGGCLLTDPAFSERAGDLLGRRSGRILDPDDPLLLFIGRHFVLPERAKAVVGRNATENPVVERFGSLGPLLEARDVNGPTTLVEGAPSPGDLEAAACLTARYGQGRDRARIRIRARFPDGREQLLDVAPGEPPGCRLL